MGLSGAAIGTYRPQYRPLSAIRYLDVNPLPTRYTLFIILVWIQQSNHAALHLFFDDPFKAVLTMN
jgi:hypothetical protein